MEGTQITQVYATIGPGGRMRSKDAAIYLGVTMETLRKWRWQKKGPPYSKFQGGSIYYLKKDLDAMLTQSSRIQTQPLGK